MPRSLPVGLAEVLKSGYAESHSTLELSLPSDIAPAITHYFATARLTIDGVIYDRQLRDTGAVKTSLTRAADRVTVELQNVDTILGVDLLAVADTLYGANVRFGRYWKDLRSAATFHHILLTGAVAGVEVNENVVRLTLISDTYAAVSVGAKEQVIRTCRFQVQGEFRGANCGYSGAKLTCNGLIDDADGCEGRHGTPLKRAKFGGFVYIEGQNTIAGAAALPVPAYNQLMKLASFDNGTITSPVSQRAFTGLDSETFAVADVAGEELTKLTPKTAVRKLNLKLAYGADPTGVSSINSALAAAVADANPGDTIYVHPGKYRITGSTFTINKRVNIEGEGASSVFFLDLNTSTDGIVIDGASGAGTYTDNVSYKNFAVLGGSNACRNALVFRNVTHADVSNVHVATGTAATGYGVVIEGCLISTWQLTVNAAMNYPYPATAPSNGILVKGSSIVPSNANLFLYPAVVVSNTSGESFFIDGSSGTAGTFNNWIIGGNIEGGALNGLHIKNASYWSVQDIHLENTSGSGDYNRVRTIIENCTHGYIGAGVGATGIFLINSDQNTLDGIIADYVSIDSNSDRNRIGRIQYNVTGVGGFVDSGTQTVYTGELDVPGVSNGFKTGIGVTGQADNLLRNGGAEIWSGSAPIDWATDSGTLTKTGTGQADTVKLYGDFAAKTASGIQYIFVNTPEPDLSLLKGKVVTVSAWVRIPSGQATQPTVNLQVWIDGGATAYGGESTVATDSWVRLSGVFLIPSSATQVQAVLRNTAASAAGYFYADGVSVVHGRTAPHSEPHRLADALALNLRNAGNYRTRFLLPSGQTSNYDITLPNGYGTNGQFLQTDGAGNWSYGTAATLSGTTNYYPFFNSSSTITTSGSLLQNFSGSLIIGSHVLFNDNTHDIGVASDNRPRNVYVATSLTAPRVYLGGGSASLTSGSGDPEGAVTAEPGSKYQRTNGTEYIKTSGSGNTGWTLVGTGGSGTVNTGAANALAYYPSSGTTVDDASGLSHSPGASPNFTVTAQNSAHVPLLLQLVASQSANALEVKNSGGSTVFNLTPSGGFTAAGDSIFSLTGSSTGSPRKLQLTNVGSGTAFRMELESEGTGFQAREAGKLQIQARYGVKIVGTRNSTFAPSFESGATTDPALYLENGVTGAIPLRVNAISSTSTNLAEFQSNASTVFSLTTTGVLGVVAASDPGSPTNSDLWRSSSRNAISIRNSGQTEDLSGSMWRSSASVFFDTTTTETSIISDTGVGTKTLAADRLKAGSHIRIKASGFYGTKATSPGTFTIKLKNGATTMLTIAAFTLPTNVADQNWWIEATGALNATGSSGTINWTITFHYNDGTGDLKTRTYTVNSTTINTTTTNALNVTGQFSVSDAANFWQTDAACIEIF